MKKILISSVEEYSGKSSIIVALGRILQEMGYEIGYFKPFGVNTVKIGDKLVDEDAVTTAENLGLKEDPTAVTLDRPYIEFVATVDQVELKKAIIEKFTELSEGKDVMLIEGSPDYKTGRAVGIGDFNIAEILDLKVLIVAKYTNDYVIDKLLNSKDIFGERLKKVIINQLTGYKTTYIQAIASKVLENAGISIVGILPKDPILAGVFVNEIREEMGGEFIVKPEHDIIIEHLIIGAMSPQSALKYFRETKNAALVTGGDRSDLLSVALENQNIKCLILTGNLEPEKSIVEKARKLSVPIILVSEDTLTTMEKLKEVFERARLRGEEKIRRIIDLVKSYVNLDEVMRYLEL